MTALILIALGLILAVLDFGDFAFDWWVGSLLLILIGLYIGGWLNPSTWIADREESAHLDRLDQEIGR